jgi:hypothetical protein
MDLIMCHQYHHSALKSLASVHIQRLPQKQQRQPSSVAKHTSSTSQREEMSQTSTSKSGFVTPELIIRPIRKDDAFVPLWKGGLEDKVMEAVRRFPDWTTVNVIRRGEDREAEKNPVTIYVTMDGPPSSATWDVLASDIAVLCSNAGRADVAVSVRQGQVEGLNGPPGHGIQLHLPYATRVPPSTSVGPRGGTTGTMGGYLEVCRPGEAPQIVGLTCHHVAVASEEMKSNGIRMVSPSDEDHDTTLRGIEGISSAVSNTRPIWQNKMNADT